MAPTLRARVPRGLQDRDAVNINAMRRMIETITEVYERYGFDPVETPSLEYTDALGKFLPDQDRPNAGVFSFQDDDDQWVSLRYDLTAPLARYVAENYATITRPYRSYRYGYVYRNEKPGPGRFRQFMQFDADTVGSDSPAADAEMCMMASDAMEALGLARGDYVVRVNNRKLLDGVLDALGLIGDEHSVRRLIVLRAVDKLDRLGERGVVQLLAEGRRDESGDFTVGAHLPPRGIDMILAFMAGRLPEGNDTIAQGQEELHAIGSLIDAAGYGDRIKLDTSVVRGLEYYTGPVYEVELTGEVLDAKGRPTRIGSVGGGGRYDKLISRFRNEPCPATGFSLGLSRLQAAVTTVGLRPAGPVLVTVFDVHRLSDYQAMVSQLRQAGIRAEMYLGKPKGMKPQLKYADQRYCPVVIIQGSDEKAAGIVQIKDMIAGAEASQSISSNAEWRAARPAQFACPESKMVEAVKVVLESAHLPRSWFGMEAK